MVEYKRLKLEKIDTLRCEKRDVEYAIEMLKAKSERENKIMLGRTNKIYMIELNSLKFTKTDVDKINVMFFDFIDKSIIIMQDRVKEIDKELEKLL